MNKKLLLGLSAILAVSMGTLVHEGAMVQSVNKGDGTALRADGDPMPPPPPKPWKGAGHIERRAATA